MHTFVEFYTFFENKFILERAILCSCFVFSNIFNLSLFSKKIKPNLTSKQNDNISFEIELIEEIYLPNLHQ